MRTDGGHASEDQEVQAIHGIVRSRPVKSGAVAPFLGAFSADLKRFPEETSPIASEEQRLEESVAMEASSQLRLVPEGTLHVWVYQARRLVFRSVFAPMYDRHGLHLRCYLVSAHGEQIGVVCESRKNYTGNMNNPLWRRPNDRARDRSRGHFELPIVSSPAFLLPTENTQLKIEIVCGILVVASAQMDLPELWEKKQTKSDAQPQGDESEEHADYVLVEPHWVSLLGEDAGAIEVMLVFCPRPERAGGSEQNGERDDDDNEFDDDKTPILASVLHEDNNAGASGPVMLDCYEEPQDQEKQQSEEAALVSAEYDRLEQRALMRRRRHEITDPRKLSDASTVSSSACTVMVTNNGTTTLYIPSQCQSATMISPPSSAITSFVADTKPDASAQDRLMEKQLWDLYYNGISSDHMPPQTSLHSFMNRASSMMSHQSEFSSRRSEASSMFSRKPSTCASDVLAYNELIQDMEMSLSAAAAEKNASPKPNDAEASDETTTPNEVREVPDKDDNLASPPVRVVPWTYKKPELLNRHGQPIKSSLKRFTYSPFADNNNELHGEQSSIQETRSKGVVLFDPDCLLKRLQASFEQNTAEADEEQKKKQMNLGRRRSVPVNQHLATAAMAGRNNATTSRISNSSSSSNDSQPAGRVGRAVSDDATESTSPETERPVVQRKRSASLHSLTDLYRQTTLRELEPRDHQAAAERWMQRYQQRQHVLLSPDSKKKFQAPLVMRDLAGRDRDRGDSRAPIPIAPPRRNSHGNQNTIAINGALLGVGKFIKVGKVTGVVRYIGPTHFASDTWIGIELCERKGKNNGTVKGCEYFTCAPDHGIFIRANRLDLSVE